MLPAQAGSQAIPDAGLGVAIRVLLVAQAIGRPNETNVPPIGHALMIAPIMADVKPLEAGTGRATHFRFCG